MSVVAIRPEVVDAAASHARILDRFIGHVTVELDGALSDFQRESLQDLLDKLIEERRNYQRVATLRPRQAA
ncbi:hypothetical protein [Arenibaculum pallidiluteum]|uniref:hypothetical protein n=1 Tax=Arenibaculum pallidiluteum TaxID=2812559 RepID=UPI001A96C80E|nr:hypothetical protein [Arenibaculum pallidiluteum]